MLVLSKLVGIALLVAMAELEPWLLEGVDRRTQQSGDCAFPSSHLQSALLGDSAVLGESAVMGESAVLGGDSGSGEAGSGDHGLLDQPPLWKVMIIVIIYLIRTALMNCTYPLNSSILMDFTPKAQRARWQSLGSIVRFGWCGSAALGGVLADQYGYSSTFLITACIQAVGTLIQFLLWPLVPRVEGNSKPAAKTVDDRASPAATAPVPWSAVMGTGSTREYVREPFLEEPHGRGSIQDGRARAMVPVEPGAPSWAPSWASRVGRGYERHDERGRERR